MGQIDIKDLVEMAADEARAERCSVAKKVLEAVIDSPDYLLTRGRFKVELQQWQEERYCPRIQ
jgi:hypothetical protein